ncbi:FtsX-like permease family protein [Isosphaeraceae bacterium EP7]
MKFLVYIFRNARRNPIRSLLTVGSVSVCLFLSMILASFLTVNDEVNSSVKIYNRVVTMSSQGLGGKVPVARVAEVAAMDGVVAASPFSWYGGSVGNERMPFAQFGVDPSQIFTIMDELSVPPDQLEAWKKDRAGCVIGAKLASDRKLKIGDPLPLKGTIYPFDLDLTVRAIYDGPSNRDLRMCMFNWDYLDEGLKKSSMAGAAGNAGIIYLKCKDPAAMAMLSEKIDKAYTNSDMPTKTQTEEAFGKMFAEYFGNLKDLILAVGVAVVFSLVCVAGNAMAMAMRERTTEVAVLKAIGFSKGLVCFIVLSEAIIVAGIGGLVGAIGAKFFFDFVDIAPYTAGFLPFFYVPWSTALVGMAASLAIGLVSGLIPAILAANLSVIKGLRKVV